MQTGEGFPADSRRETLLTRPQLSSACTDAGDAWVLPFGKRTPRERTDACDSTSRRLPHAADGVFSASAIRTRRIRTRPATMAVEKKAESSSQNFVAGSLAGCAMRATLFPIDTIKTNMQRSGTGLIATVRSLRSNPSALAALYRGLTPAVLEIGVNRGALMSVSTAIKQRMPAGCSEFTRDVGAGFVAGSLKTVFLHPLDTLTCRGQVGRAQLDLIWCSTAQRPRPQFSVLYSGISPAILRSACGMSIWYSVRNDLERKANGIASLQSSPWLRDWLVGMASTAFTDLCTFPLDTLKKNLQADGGDVFVLARRLLVDGGVLRLYHGYTPRLMIVAVNGGLWNFLYVRIQEFQRVKDP